MNMVETKTLCLELCRQLLNSSGFVEEEFEIKSYQKEIGKILLETSDGNYNIHFKLVSKDNNEEGFDNNFFYFKDENYVTFIENITVTGYHCPKFNELHQKQLLSLFKNLAVHHSKHISKVTEQVTNEKLGPEENQKVLDSLYVLTESMHQKKINLKILKQGISQLISSKETLQPKHKNLYVNGSSFQKKILFKDGEDHYTECVLFNLLKGRPVSIVYDMLCLIYLVTDQEQRQKYFHEITSHYYEVLKDNLSGIDVYMPLWQYEREIKTCIPYVKLELVCFHVLQLYKEMKINKKKDIVDMFNLNNDSSKSICELILEIYEYVLAPEINIEDCFKIVKDAIGTNYENLTYQLIKLGGVLGLLGAYYKLKISVTQKGSNRVFHLFAKSLPKGYEMISSVFLKEEFFYTTFMAELKKAGLEDITSFLPRCYFVRQEDIIVFEDLSYSNYRALDCDESFSYEMMQLVVKQFAKMHACSLLYEEIMTKKLGKEIRLNDYYIKYIEESMYVKGNEFADIINNCGIDSTVNFIFDQFPDVPKEISMETFRESTRKLFKVMIEKFQICEKYRNVICHGDVWGGNILFKFDINKPLQCCLVDFQHIRYNPPAHDLLAFLYINTDKATRTKYMSSIINQYYDELSAIFKRYDFDLNKIYPYDHYLDCCNFMKSQAICLASLTYPLSLDRQKVQDISPEKQLKFMTVDKNDFLQELMKDNRVRARFREIVEDLYELCLENNLE